MRRLEIQITWPLAARSFPLQSVIWRNALETVALFFFGIDLNLSFLLAFTTIPFASIKSLQLIQNAYDWKTDNSRTLGQMKIPASKNRTLAKVRPLASFSGGSDKIGSFLLLLLFCSFIWRQPSSPPSLFTAAAASEKEENEKGGLDCANAQNRQEQTCEISLKFRREKYGFTQ